MATYWSTVTEVDPQHDDGQQPQEYVDTPPLEHALWLNSAGESSRLPPATAH